ncbi:MAG TPA: hypothetical protein VF707_16065 [Ardenticatenaceae bacterium]
MATATPEYSRAGLSGMLQPMGIGKLLDRTIYFYRTHFLQLLTYVALFTVPLTLINSIFSYFAFESTLTGSALEIGTTPEEMTSYYVNTLGALGGTYLLGLLTYLFLPLQAAGIAVALRGFMLEGREVALREMLQGVRRHVPALLVLGLAGLVLSLLLTLTLILAPVGMAILTIFGLAFGLAPFVLVYEGSRGMDAIKRSWMLIQRSIWRVMGIVVALFLFGFAVGLAIQAGAQAATGAFAMLAENPTLLYIVQTVLTSLFGLLVGPVSHGVYGLLYFDLRVRHEGLDIALAASEGMDEAQVLAAPQGDEQPVLNNETWRIIGILSGAYTGLFVLLCACIFLLGIGFAALISQGL